MARKPRDQFGGIGVAAARRRIGRAEAPLRIAAQGDDVAHADLPITARDLVDLVARRADAGEMRGGLDIAVSRRMRATVAWVRSRVEPPAP